MQTTQQEKIYGVFVTLHKTVSKRRNLLSHLRFAFSIIKGRLFIWQKHFGKCRFF